MGDLFLESQNCYYGWYLMLRRHSWEWL